MSDAEPEQQPRGVGRALRLDRGEEIIDRLFLPALAPEQLGAVRLQPEDVGGTPVEPAKLQKFGNALFAQPLDVERAAADEMAQPLEFLRVADEAAGAADIDLALFGIGRASCRERVCQYV